MLDLSGSGAEPLREEDPRRIGGIPLVGRLGSGGMGRVYLGVRDGRYIAVKQLLPSVVGEDMDFLRRFRHELDNLARLPAEATAPLLASDRTARPPWLATAYVPGLTLREAVELHGGPLPVDDLWLLLREAAGGLAAVHALDMVHRDLKPSNVMLTVDGATLIDFGVARAAEQSQLTRTGMVVGMPAYMAPEQASSGSQLSGATDVFALGSLIAYAACGRPPFGDESGHAVLYRIVHEEPDVEAVRALDPEIAELVASCLDKDFEGRPTAAELHRSAAAHGPFTAPLWPEAIGRRLSQRAAFAAHVQEIDEPPPPPSPPPVPTPTQVSAGPGPGPEPGPELEPVPQQPGPGPGSRPEPRERRRRTRIMLAVLPVVVVMAGTTLAVRHLPYTFSQDDHAGATPSVPATGTPDPTPSTSGASPPGTATPGKTPGEKRDGGKETDETQVSVAGGTGAGAQGGSDGSDGSGGGGGSTGSDGGTSSGGTSTSGDTSPSGSSSTTGGTGNTPSGTHGYRNGDNNECLVTVINSTDTGSCSDAAASWTLRSASGGRFELVSKQNGQCLSANMLGQAVFTGGCDQASARLWRAGSAGSLVSVSNGGCLDLGFGSGTAAMTCTGKASQRWAAV